LYEALGHYIQINNSILQLSQQQQLSQQRIYQGTPPMMGPEMYACAKEANPSQQGEESQTHIPSSQGLQMASSQGLQVASSQGLQMASSQQEMEQEQNQQMQMQMQAMQQAQMQAVQAQLVGIVLLSKGHPSKYYQRSTLLNFSDQTRSGAFNVIHNEGQFT
jgi:hypothetical protein